MRSPAWDNKDEQLHSAINDKNQHAEPLLCNKPKMNIVGRFLQHLRGCPYGDDATSNDVGLDLDHLYGDALSPDSPRASASGRWLQGGRRTRKRSRTPPMMRPWTIVGVLSCVVHEMQASRESR